MYQMYMIMDWMYFTYHLYVLRRHTVNGKFLGIIASITIIIVFIGGLPRPQATELGSPGPYRPPKGPSPSSGLSLAPLILECLLVIPGNT